MATIYVDSNASGANDGTSFADAFTSITSVTTLAAGDDILIASDHDESGIGAFDFPTNINDWARLISVNSSTEVYEAGASISLNGTLGIINLYVRGLTIITTNDIDGGGNTRDAMYFEDCTMTFDTLTGSSVGDVTLMNCDVTITDSAFGFFLQFVRMVGGSIASTSLGAGDGIVVNSPFDATFSEFIGVDLSGVVNAAALADYGTVTGMRTWLRFIGCRLPSGVDFTIRGSRNSFVFEAIGCEVGTITDPTIQYRYETYGGISESDTTVTRTDGASDGTTSYTMKMTSLADETLGRSVGIRNGENGISVYVESGDTNLRVYFAHDAVGQGTAGRLDSSEVWVDYLGPSEDATADTQLVSLRSAQAKFGETPSDLTDDASSWSGTGVGTVQRIDIPIDPTVAGYATVWVHFAPGAASDAIIHFDPKIEVT